MNSENNHNAQLNSHVSTLQSIFALSSAMFQKLTQSNVNYYQEMLAEIFQLATPIGGSHATANNLPYEQLNTLVNKMIAHNTALDDENTKIIRAASQELNSVLHRQQQDLLEHKLLNGGGEEASFNPLDVWSQLIPTGEELTNSIKDLLPDDHVKILAEKFNAVKRIK